MKKTIIYRLDSNDKYFFIVERNAYVFIEPLKNKKIWIVDGVDDVYTLMEDEFEDNDYYLSFEDAQKAKDCEIKKEQDYVSLCLDFARNIKKFNRGNPFLAIAEYKKNKEILRFVDIIKDPIIKHYIKHHLALHDYISDSTKEIMEKTEKL